MKTKSEITTRTKLKAEKIWQTAVIKELYTKINHLTTRKYNLQLQITKHFHYIEYMNILEITNKRIERKLKIKRKIIFKKLKTLQRKQQNNMENTQADNIQIAHKFHERTKNYTNIEFNEEEKELLNKGLKHNTEPNNNAAEQNKHLLNIENAILRTEPADQNDIRTTIIQKITKNENRNHNIIKNTNQKTINSINKKLEENDSIITKADKGNTVVILKESEYNQKIDDYIKKNKIQQLKTDPTQKYQEIIKNAINTSNKVLNNYQKRYDKMIKSAAPNLNGLPKIHKIDVPIRPLIDFTTAPSYRIAKRINIILKEKIHISNNRSIKNTLELVNKIESLTIPHRAKLASFDITNMYTNIPITETIEITQQLLIEQGTDKTEVEEIIKLLRIITQQNYFKHGDKFYTQLEGLPMGSPLSGTLADIYLNHIENKHIISNKNKYLKNILYWHRYVDDILILFNGTLRQLDKLQEYINNIHKNIQFTLELEENNTINFLDLTIINQNNKHTFKIHRKPTQTDQTIHKNSNHPYQQKMASFNHMINRLNNIPMNKNDYNEELNTIKYIAAKNGYNTKIIDIINKKIKRKHQNNNYTTLSAIENKAPKYITTNYKKETCRIIQQTFKNYGYKAAYRTVNKVEKALNKRNKEEIDTGVYKLKCNECPAFYIGQTGRSFKKRYDEHTKEVNKENPKSNYADHLKSNKHTHSNYETNLKIIHRCKKGPMLDRLEEFQIYKNRNNQHLLNDKTNGKTNKLYDLIIRKNKNHKT